MSQTINPTYDNSSTSNSPSIYTNIEQNKSTAALEQIKDKLPSQKKVLFSSFIRRIYPPYKNEYTSAGLVNPKINQKVSQYILINQQSSNVTNIKRPISEESDNYYSSAISQETSIFNLKISEQNKNFQDTMKSLLDLQEIDPDLEEDDEDEIYYPSTYAVSGCIELLIKLYQILGNTFPYGFASVEGRGGVDLIWKNKVSDKQVWFKFPVNDIFQSSVYYRQGDNSNLIKQPEIIFIAKLLQWLFTEDSFDTL